MQTLTAEKGMHLIENSSQSLLLHESGKSHGSALMRAPRGSSQEHCTFQSVFEFWVLVSVIRGVTITESLPSGATEQRRLFSEEWSRRRFVSGDSVAAFLPRKQEWQP